MSFHFISTGAAVALAVGLVAVPVTAAEAQSPPALLQLAQAPEEAELVAFAAATIKVIEIQQAMQRNMETADEEDTTRIRGEAQAEMVDAVEGEGLTIEQYNAIAQLTRTDPDLANTVQRLIEQQLGG